MAAGTALRRIRLLVLDADGVLTDGRLHYGPQGDIFQVFHARDGYGIKALMAAGVTVAIISGRSSAAVAARCAELEIPEVHQGVADKGAALDALLARLGLARAECACVGDDVPDVAMMRIAGLSIAVADAHPVALRAAHRRTRHNGGNGAVREVCDWLIAAHVAGARAHEHHANGAQDTAWRFAPGPARGARPVAGARDATPRSATATDRRGTRRKGAVPAATAAAPRRRP